jgi:hypothetical protein
VICFIAALSFFSYFLLLVDQIRLSSEQLDSLTVNRSEWPNKSVRSSSTGYDEPEALQYLLTL